MLTTFLAALLSTLLLHPGHSTRVELQAGAESKSIELSMRIDHGDLETALRKRLRRPVVIERLTDAEAENWIGGYLRDTLRLEDAAIAPEQFHWVGWERQRNSSWLHAEIHLPPSEAAMPESVTLRIETLLEVEPELNHVVSVREGGRPKSVVLTKEKSTVRIRLRAAPPTAAPPTAAAVSGSEKS